MSTNEHVEAEQWQAYERIQRVVERSRRGVFVDDACSRLVNELPRTAALRVPRRFMNLVSQVKRLTPRREEIDREVARTRAPVPEPRLALEVQEQAARVRMALSDDEQAIEGCLASGLSYGDVARLVGAPTGTVKARVARTRARVRRAMALAMSAA